jgi:putative membrane protein
MEDLLMRRMIDARRVALAALLVALGACAKGGDGTADGEATPADTMAAAPTPAASGEQAAPMGEGAGTAADTLDDNQMLSVLDAMNQTEILPSQVAQQKATNPELKQYAQMMVTQHTALGDSMSALAQANGLAPAPHPLAEGMLATANSSTQRLQGLQGMDFDTAYAALMALSHQTGLATVQERMIPRARNAALRTALETKVTPAVEMHLRDIERIRGTLGTGPR